MKTIEEKAKAYDEALERAKMEMSKDGMKNDVIARHLAETIFPELKESKDERIRKELLEHCKNLAEPYILTGNKCPQIQSWIAWLEKQAERKTPQWMIDFLDGYRRKIGCCLDHDEARDVEGKILCITQWLENKDEQEKDILEDAILDCNEDGLIAQNIKYKNENQSEQNHRQEIEPFEAEHGKYYYCIKDYFCGGRKQASKGDVIQALRGLPIMGLKDTSEYFLPVNSIKCNSSWNEEDEHRIKDTVYFLDTAKKHYASTEELDACIDWIQSFKDRIQLQTKPELGDEDKDMIQALNACIDVAIKSGMNYISFDSKSILIEKVKNWLKSLRPQNKWKPSEKQMDSITCAVKKMKESACYDSELVSLLNDLKKLNEG